MNKIHKVIFNIKKGIWQVVSEIARSSGQCLSVGEEQSTSNQKKSISLLIFFSISLTSLPITYTWANGSEGKGGGWSDPASKDSIGYLNPDPSTASGNTGLLIVTGSIITQNITGGAGATGSSTSGPLKFAGANGGGGGGTGVQARAQVTNNAVLTGGAGGYGGYGRGNGGNGGGGAGLTTNSALINNGTIIGGSGGSQMYNSGGGGGSGVFVSGNTIPVTITNYGKIIGGAGGYYLGSDYAPGFGGAGEGGAPGATVSSYSSGGAAVAGGNIVINNYGTLTAGLGGNGTSYYAIDFQGGLNNQLNLYSGSVINGAIRLTSGKSTVTEMYADRLLNNDIIFNGEGVFNTNGFNVTANGIISGTGTVSKTANGTLFLNGANTYTGGTTINGGTVSIATNTNLGSASSNVTMNGGTLETRTSIQSGRTINLSSGGGSISPAAGTTLQLSGIIQDTSPSNSGSLTKINKGILSLSGANTYTGKTTVAEGSLNLTGSGSISQSSKVDVQNNTFDISATTSGSSINSLAGENSGILALGSKTLNLTNANDTFAGSITGNGALNINGGTEVLSGTSNSYGGTATVNNSATLYVNGIFGNSLANVNVANGGTLRGNGTINGNLYIADNGTVSAGEAADPSIGTLTVTGDMLLSQNSNLNYQFGQANGTGGHSNDLITVGGDLTLDGKLNIALPANNSMDTGVYRIFNYQGALTNSGLDFGTLPASFDSNNFYIQTSIAHQINLVNTSGLTLRFWDGDTGTRNDRLIQGGDGTWRNGVEDNWTIDDASTNAPWGNNNFAVFMGQGGNVTVDTTSINSGIVNTSGMQFYADGYVINGDALNLIADNPQMNVKIIVGDGTPGSKNYVGTINSQLTGDVGLEKDGFGTLVLNANNTYTGDTTVDNGTLQISSNNNLGSGNKLTLDGGSLSTTGTFQLNHNIVIGSGSGEISTATGTVLTQSLGITGDGGLLKTGAGTLLLTGANSWAGATTVEGGSLVLQNNQMASLHNLTINDATLDIASLAQGATVNTLSGNNAANIVLGDKTLMISNTIPPVKSSSFNGMVSGTGGLVLNNANETLGGVNTYTGSTQLTASDLALSGAGAITDSALVNLNNSKFDISGINADTSITALNGDNLSTVNIGTKNLTISQATGDYAGQITGSGILNINSGEQTFSGNSIAYAGEVNLTNASLFVNNIFGSSSSSVSVHSGSTLAGNGTIGGNVALDDNATLSPGDGVNQIGTLKINGDLQLANLSQLNYQLGEANVVGGALNDLTQINGNLTLDGVLNVTTSPGGSFDPGVYRLISYNGQLTDNGMTIATIPSNTYSLQTSVENQVNLLNSAGLMLNVWDGEAGPKYNGEVNGGNGTWQSTPGNENWTDSNGIINSSFIDRSFAVFEATPGNVTVDKSLGNITVAGMQFASDGYRIQGDPIILAGSVAAPEQSIIRVGDGTQHGASYTATIDSELMGNSSLIKTDLGSLVLSGENTYTGGTTINGGIVSITRDANLGDSAGSVTLNGGTLRITDNIGTSRSVITDNASGTIDVVADKTFSVLQGITGTGSLIKQGGGELQLNQPGTYAGTTHISQGTLSTMRNNVLNNASPITIDNGATLNLADHNQQIGSLGNSGTVIFGTTAGTQMIVNGDYQGNNGQLLMNTALAGDNARSDRMIINGITSGTTQIAVTNRDGLGAPTTEGIKLVDVNGISNGNFTLKSDYLYQGKAAIIAGAYSYQLYKNGVSTPQDGDWYLRSQVTNPVTPVPPTSTGSNGTNPVTPVPPTSTGSNGTNPVTPVPPTSTGSNGTPAVQVASPLWQPGVPLYESYPSVLAQFNNFSTLKQREGGRSWSSSDSLINGIHLGSWGRIVGDKSKETATLSPTASTLRTNSAMWQLGADGVVHENAYGTLIAGVNMRYGKMNADINSLFGNGGIDSTAYGPGATLTWYGDNGWYVDNQAQFSWYSSSLYSETLKHSMVENNHAYGYALSSETGKHIRLSDNWTLTPQAQVVYSRVNFQDFTDPYGTHVTDGNNGSTLIRVGISPEYQHAWSTKNETSSLRVYGIANMEKAYSAATQVEVSNTPITRRGQTLWQSFGGGGELQMVNGKYQLYGEVSGKTALSSSPEKNYALNATVGIKMKF
jgi:outer membrane autotransporter protein